MNLTNIVRKVRWQLIPKAKEAGYINKRIDGLNLPEHIVPMQKSIPPYMPVEGGHGFMGVLLYNTQDDTIQCHICGEWWRSMGQHINAHDIKSKDYKDKFGLYRKEPLSGLITRAKYQAIAVKRNKKHDLNRYMTREGRLKGMKKCNDGKIKRGAMSIQFQNQYGTCEAQLRNRVKEHVAKFGYFPRSTSDLLLSTMLWRRFGSVEKAKAYYGYK